jgi:hypothetical protein
MINRNILNDTPLPTLITHLKHDAAEELVTILVDLLRQQGFSLEDLLNGLAGYANSQGMDDTVCRVLEQAVEAVRQKP